MVVYEGERAHVDANNKLGSFVISGVQRARAGEPKVDVSFSLDANGILNVSARDQVTNAEARAEIKAEKGRLTSDDIDKVRVFGPSSLGWPPWKLSPDRKY